MSEKSRSVTLDGTSIDLGDDLLEKTLTREQARDLSQKKSVSLSEQVRNAEILYGEGLVDDAKKNLYRVLRTDPKHRAARDFLKKIRDEELEILLSSSNDALVERERVRARTEFQENAQSIKEIVDQLDQDLKLGLDRDRESPFPKPEDAVEFSKNLTTQMEKASIKERLDLSVAFMEMGLYWIAAQQLQQAKAECSDSNDEESVSTRISVNVLLGMALVLAGESLKAILLLQEAIQDVHLKDEHKFEHYYWMGRGQEELENKSKAILNYRWIVRRNESYRDVQFRLQQLAK